MSWDSIENILLLSFDALRADHLSCHGYERTTSPAIDRIARESIRFDNAYSVSSHTREAVPGLLTGQYPDEAIDSEYRLLGDTLAATVSRQGFTTGAFHSNPYVSRAYGFDDGFDEFDDDLHLSQYRLVALAQRALDKLRGRNYARATEINDRSLSWLDTVDSTDPVFLWNHYMDTHGPYEAPREYRESFDVTDVSAREARSLYRRALTEPESITTTEQETLIDLYDAEIRYTDEQVEDLLQTLRDRGALERSLLILTADHGDAFGENDYFGHPRRLDDELVHVPMLVRPPGGRDETVSTPVSTLDVAATVRDVLGLDGRSPGVSLLGDHGTRSDETGAERRVVYQQARGEDDRDTVVSYAARSRDAVCLCEHDTESDRIDWGDHPQGPLCDRLRSHVEGRRDADTDGERGATEAEASGEVQRRLSALGYDE